MLDKEEKDRISKILLQKAPNLCCPMCSKNEFVMTDGYFSYSLSDNIGKVIMGGQTLIPAIGLICRNCGFISHYAIGQLGLLTEKETHEQ